MKFTEWLQTQANRDDPVGDLARDAAQDSGFPETENLTDYESHLEDLCACGPAIIALQRAWQEYTVTP